MMTDEDAPLPPLAPELASLRDAGAPMPPSGFEERVGARLAESLASLGAAGSAGASAATAGAGAGGTAVGAGATAAVSGAVVSVGKLVVGAALVLTTGVGLGIAVDRIVLRPTPERPAPAVITPTPAANPAEPPEPPKPPVVDSAPTEPVVDSVPTTVAPERPAVKPDAVKPSGGRDVSLAAERALLEVARAALAKGEIDAALRALDRHQREHAQGRLREEREALFIEALRAAGRNQEAETRRARFLQEFPNSLLSP